VSMRTLSAQLSEAGWTQRVQQDRERAKHSQTSDQREITAIVMARSLEIGAESFALTGSTARQRRTPLSDLDFHVIGPRPDVSDLPGDLDVVASSATRFRRRLLDGDDFAQWTLRYGCVLHDSGAMRDGVRLIVARHLWPSGERKLASLPDHRREIERLIQMGDRDSAQEQVRAAITTAARGLLLDGGIFPLSRRELPAQLGSAGHEPLARMLDMVIHEEPNLTDLAATLAYLDAALAASSIRPAA
jgi:hypothetical protein